MKAHPLIALAIAGASLHGVAVASEIIVNAGRGPVAVTVPSSYRPGVPMPLVLLLHGYNASGAIQESYMQLAPLAQQFGFFYAHPDGTMNPAGSRYWNATDACCDLFQQGVDDSGYLLALIHAIAGQLTVDALRVCIVGHSNGGFMAYRMACDHPETIAAIASLAGATYLQANQCASAAPVHVLEIHGTSDATILYGGGAINQVAYPGAVATAQQRAAFAGCTSIPETNLPPLDLDTNLPGAETTVARYANGCAAAGSAELWTVQNGTHIPALSSSFGPLVIGFLLSHPKPVPTGAGSRPASETGDLGADPNPFTGMTQVEFGMKSRGGVSLHVVDIAGRRIRTILRQHRMDAGLHPVVWDGRSDAGAPVAAGVYFLVLTADAKTRTAKVVRLR